LFTTLLIASMLEEDQWRWALACPRWCCCCCCYSTVSSYLITHSSSSVLLRRDAAWPCQWRWRTVI